MKIKNSKSINSVAIADDAIVTCGKGKLTEIGLEIYANIKVHVESFR